MIDELYNQFERRNFDMREPSYPKLVGYQGVRYPYHELKKLNTSFEGEKNTNLQIKRIYFERLSLTLAGNLEVLLEGKQPFTFCLADAELIYKYIYCFHTSILIIPFQYYKILSNHSDIKEVSLVGIKDVL
jgi:hypothetical protein